MLTPHVLSVIAHQNRGLKLLSIDKLEDIVKIVTTGAIPPHLTPAAAAKKVITKKSRRN
jgi:hypothetical protein